jgi:hypothetical protein
MSTITETANIADVAINDPSKEAINLRSDEGKQPLKYSGSLDKYEHFDVTPTIGREYPNLSLTELLDSPESETLIRDLAITSTWASHSIRLTLLNSNHSLTPRRRFLP